MAKKQTKKSTPSSKPMSITQLFLYILLAIVIFWILRLILNVAKWLMGAALIVGLIVAIVWLINQYWVGKQKR